MSRSVGLVIHEGPGAGSCVSRAQCLEDDGQVRNIAAFLLQSLVLRNRVTAGLHQMVIQIMRSSWMLWISLFTGEKECPSPWLVECIWYPLIKYGA